MNSYRIWQSSLFVSLLSKAKVFVFLAFFFSSSAAFQTIRLNLKNVTISNTIQLSVYDVLVLKFGAHGAGQYQVMPSPDTGFPDYSLFCQSAFATICPASFFKPAGTWPAGSQSQCFQRSSASDVAGLFVFQPMPDEAGTDYNVCVQVYSSGTDVSLACVNISVVLPQPVFANVSINGAAVPANGWQTVETAAGCQTTVSLLAVDNRTCQSPGCVLPPSPAASASGAPPPVSCSSSAWEQQQCSVGCGRLQARNCDIITCSQRQHTRFLIVQLALLSASCARCACGGGGRSPPPPPSPPAHPHPQSPLGGKSPIAPFDFPPSLSSLIRPTVLSGRPTA